MLKLLLAESLQAYRKEAIYRHMREAKRDLQRSQEKTQKLKDAIEAVSERSAAFNHFYDTVSVPSDTFLPF